MRILSTTHLLQNAQALDVRGCLSLRFLGGLVGKLSLSDAAPAIDVSIFGTLRKHQRPTRLRRNVESKLRLIGRKQKSGGGEVPTWPSAHGTSPSAVENIHHCQTATAVENFVWPRLALASCAGSLKL